MATGYEVKMYQDISSVAKDLNSLAGLTERLCMGVERIADALVERNRQDADDLLGVARATGVLVGEEGVTPITRKEPPV